jgi:hypothetical protein
MPWLLIGALAAAGLGMLWRYSRQRTNGQEMTNRHANRYGQQRQPETQQLIAASISEDESHHPQHTEDPTADQQNHEQEWTRRNALATEQSAKAARATAWFTGLLLLANTIYLVFQYHQLMALKDQVAQARIQNDISATTAVAARTDAEANLRLTKETQRAWLAPSIRQFPLRPNEEIPILVTIMNAGRSPALKIDAYAWHDITPKLPDKLPGRPKTLRPGSALLAPGSAAEIPVTLRFGSARRKSLQSWPGRNASLSTGR